MPRTHCRRPFEGAEADAEPPEPTPTPKRRMVASVARTRTIKIECVNTRRLSSAQPLPGRWVSSPSVAGDACFDHLVGDVMFNSNASGSPTLQTPVRTVNG